MAVCQRDQSAHASQRRTPLLPRYPLVEEFLTTQRCQPPPTLRHRALPNEKRPVDGLLKDKVSQPRATSNYRCPQDLMNSSPLRTEDFCLKAFNKPQKISERPERLQGTQKVEYPPIVASTRSFRAPSHPYLPKAGRLLTRGNGWGPRRPTRASLPRGTALFDPLVLIEGPLSKISPSTPRKKRKSSRSLKLRGHSLDIVLQLLRTLALKAFRKRWRNP